MIYKDLFIIKIDGVPYEETDGPIPKQKFTLEEMKKIYVNNFDRNVEAIYEPLLTEDILDDSEIYGWAENDNDYESEEEDYED